MRSPTSLSRSGVFHQPSAAAGLQAHGAWLAVIATSSRHSAHAHGPSIAQKNHASLLAAACRTNLLHLRLSAEFVGCAAIVSLTRLELAGRRGVAASTGERVFASSFFCHDQIIDEVRDLICPSHTLHTRPLSCVCRLPPCDRLQPMRVSMGTGAAGRPMRGARGCARTMPAAQHAGRKLLCVMPGLCALYHTRGMASQHRSPQAPGAEARPSAGADPAVRRAHPPRAARRHRGSRPAPAAPRARRQR